MNAGGCDRCATLFEYRLAPRVTSNRQGEIHTSQPLATSMPQLLFKFLCFSAPSTIL